MPDANAVAKHYTHGSLVAALRQGISRLGKTTDSVTLEDLQSVDEFHIGGHIATERFLDQLDIDPSHHTLDVGCGLGGASRFAAARYGCRVTGVDLTHEYVEAGNIICSWLGFDDRVNLELQDATRLSCSDDTFDRAYMLHVGMNISDKGMLAKELHRVIRPGGRLGIYDVMRVGEGDLIFPVPWAADPRGSAVDSVDTYQSALEEAGFKVSTVTNRREFALEFFEQLQSTAAGEAGPPPLGLHILMGQTSPRKISNMISNIERQIIAPCEIVAERLA